MTINLEKRNKLCEKILNNQLNLKNIENNILTIFRKIKEVKHLKDSEIYFEELSDLHTAISYLYFTDKISLNEFMDDFISVYDRIDVESERQDLFIKIKNNDW